MKFVLRTLGHWLIRYSSNPVLTTPQSPKPEDFHLEPQITPERIQTEERYPAVDLKILCQYWNRGLDYINFKNFAKNEKPSSIRKLEEIGALGAQEFALTAEIENLNIETEEVLIIIGTCAVDDQGRRITGKNTKHLLIGLPCKRVADQGFIAQSKTVPVFNSDYLSPDNASGCFVITTQEHATSVLDEKLSSIADMEREDPATIATWSTWWGMTCDTLLNCLDIGTIHDANLKLNKLRQGLNSSWKSDRYDHKLVAYIFKKMGDTSTAAIGTVYKNIINNSEILNNLKLLSVLAGKPTGTDINNKNSRDLDEKLTGNMDIFDAQEGKRDIFSLDSTQRQAVRGALAIKNGELLAVNGPPGSGKTSMLRAVIASIWVNAAIAKSKDCPIVMAAGATNQSVTNVIKAFGDAPHPIDGFPLASRWLPDLTSYGSFLPSKTQIDTPKKRSELNHYICVVSEYDGYAQHRYLNRQNLLDPAKLGELESYYLKCADSVLNKKFRLVEDALAEVWKNLVSCQENISDIRQISKQSSSKLSALLESRRPLWSSARIKSVEDYLDMTSQDDLVEKLKMDYHEHESLLDIVYRTECFYWAAHYWEGRFLIAQRTRITSSHPYNVLESLRRLCMLTPCLVSTLHSLPHHLKFKSETTPVEDTRTHVFEGIDFLILDEAGQTSPEIAAASFALAKKALVIGDVKQLKPVWKSNRLTERAIARSVNADNVLDGIIRCSRSIASGNILGAARIVSKYHEETDFGISMLYHYRCKPSIIAYCNSLVYAGQLKLHAKEEDDFPLPAMSWVEVRESPIKIAGSWRNDTEANEIMEWMVSQWPTWQKGMYAGLPIYEIIAVLTPYRPQAELLRTILTKMFSEARERERDRSALHWPTNRELEKTVIGTVHSLQGAECPIVCFSLVEGPDNLAGSFVDLDPSLMNVAVSRAKKAFILFANPLRVFSGGEHATAPVHQLGNHLQQVGRRLYPRDLVIIEAEGKKETLIEILGKNAMVVTTIGKIDTIPIGGVDIAQGFVPNYVLRQGKKELLDRIETAAIGIDKIYLATDDDRMGELIAWHVSRNVFGKDRTNTPVHRIRLGNLTRDAVLSKYSKPTKLDRNKVMAEAVREIIDVLIVQRFEDKLKNTNHTHLENTLYSDLLNRHEIENTRKKRITRVGRVQAAVLRLFKNRLVESINQSDKYRINVTTKIRDTSITGRVVHDNQWSFEIDLAQRLIKSIQGQSLDNVSLPRNIVWKRTAPAANTVHILIEAWRRYKILPMEASRALQRLYEGSWGIGENRPRRVDLIDPIVSQYDGRGHPPISPLDRALPPPQMEPLLDTTEMSIYRIIWDFFDMSEKEFLRCRRIEIDCGSTHLNKNTLIRFEGFGVNDLDSDNLSFLHFIDSNKLVTSAHELVEVWPNLHGASINAELEQVGQWRDSIDDLLLLMKRNRLGRPSTYAQIIYSLNKSKFVEFPIDQGPLRLTDNGLETALILEQEESELSAPEFTRQLQSDLNDIESGDKTPADVLIKLAPLIAPGHDINHLKEKIWKNLEELEARIAKQTTDTRDHGPVISKYDLEYSADGVESD